MYKEGQFCNKLARLLRMNNNYVVYTNVQAYFKIGIKTKHVNEP
jgi:hypothetical protein